MVTRIQRWGNSQGLRLGKALLAEAGIDVGDEVEISVRAGELVLSPVRRIRGRHDLAELVARLPRNSRAPELDWGEPVGREAW
jgi:antitoxin MazE